MPSPTQTPLSTYSLLFTGIIKYQQSRISVTSQLERKLSDMGEMIGRRVWESVCYRKGTGGNLVQSTDRSSVTSSVTAALTSSVLLNSSTSSTTSASSTNLATSTTLQPTIALNTSKLQRELRIEGALKMLQMQIWPHLYGKKALDVKKAEDPPNSYLFYDEFPLEERHVSLPREISSLRTSAFTAGIIEGCLRAANFETVVRAHKPEGKNFFVFIVTLKEETLRREEMWK